MIVVSIVGIMTTIALPEVSKYKKSHVKPKALSSSKPLQICKPRSWLRISFCECRRSQWWLFRL
ncbi:MAG: hypothetical protein R3A45_02220 [Bdellovibrionota bacterium]